MTEQFQSRPVEVLLVEDNPGDVRLTREALSEGKIRNHLTVAFDGAEALAVLRREGHHVQARRPDLILLDLNLPKKNGHEVLMEIKNDAELATIPVVILTSSAADDDIARTYALRANCYVVKPVGLDAFLSIVKQIEGFWLEVVALPERVAAS